MNINLKLSGIAEAIVENMIEGGYATSKTEAIRLALLSFGGKVNKQNIEDELVVRKMQKIDEEIASGKVKLINSEEALGKYAKYLKK